MAGKDVKDGKRKRLRITRTGAARLAVLVVCFALLGYLFMSLAYYFFQDEFLFQPNPDIEIYPSDLGMDYEDLYLETPDGETINAWYIPYDDNASTVLYCHGNKGNIGGYLPHLRILHNCGLNVLAFDYRGYGESTGHPTEDGTYIDARCAWDYLTTDHDTDPATVIVYGRSMGGPIAAWLASRVSPGALVLDSTFTTYEDEARDLTFVLPVGSLSTMEYPTIEYLKHTDCPVLVVHSKDDMKLRYHHGKELYEAAPGEKMFLKISGGHSDCVETSERVYGAGVKEFVEAYLEA